MEKRITIRELVPSDYEDVSELWREHGNYCEELDGRAVISRMLERNPRLLLVAEMGEEVVGVVLGSYNGRIGLISRLMVHPNYRQMGVGSALLAELENRLHQLGCRIIGLLVLEENRTAITVYEKRGYILLPQVRYMYKEIG